eukprot:Transcript_21680.p1 GENE.Transcript_21680~~Transcript_21680.p1  ORF type:complete len:636 (-),score=346.15 Transcript_21680:280-2187(-)
MGKDKHKHKDKKRDKELAKLHETDEEKRARRLAKKAAKAAKAEEESQVGGYSNHANPWNDPNLSEQFVWGKKVDKDRSRGIDESSSKEAQKRKRQELQVELEKVKRAREQREIDKEQWEEERRLLDREREQMAFADYQKREDDFQLEQSQVRARKRVQEGRAKPIDMLADSLQLLSETIQPAEALEMRLQDPLLVFEHLSGRELTDLRRDIEQIAQLDEAQRTFWDAMLLVSETALREYEQDNGGGGGGGSGAHAEVHKDIDAMLSQKGAGELEQLEHDIVRQLQGGEVDTDYYTDVLERLKLTRARLMLTTTFKRIKRRHVELLSGGGAAAAAPAPASAEPDEPEVAGATAAGDAGGGASASGRFSPELLQDDDEVDFDGSDDEAPDELPAGGAATSAASDAAAAAESGPGRYSPTPLDGENLRRLGLDRDTAVDEAADRRQLEALRSRIRARAMGRMPDVGGGGGSSGAPDEDSVGSSQVQAEARKGFEQGEARFSFEVPLEKKVAWWHDRYRPRKPKYFNRVHTGYEWNKYNQTHYDHDNPPPKMVQGYKFNVFFPDLIDRTKTPTYDVLPDPDGSKDVCILRIRGGPPYEDIAFKVVNREWEYSHKRGFKCRFERGILQLYFNFKRHRYRR